MLTRDLFAVANLLVCRTRKFQSVWCRVSCRPQCWSLTRGR